MNSKFQSSFTLLEILVYIGVFSIVMGVLISFIIWVTHSNIKAQAIRETSDNAREVLETMVYEIKTAKSVYIPTSTSTQLSLETLNYLPEGESFTYIDFFLCGTQICFKKESQIPVALTSDKVEIKDLNFTLIGNVTSTPSVQIALKADYKNPQNRPEYQASVNVTTTASLRSY